MTIINSFTMDQAIREQCNIVNKYCSLVEKILSIRGCEYVNWECLRYRHMLYEALKQGIIEIEQYCDSDGKFKVKLRIDKEFMDKY